MARLSSPLVMPKACLRHRGRRRSRRVNNIRRCSKSGCRRFPLADEIVRRGAARAGLTWHFCRPPVQGLEYEMDCRAVAVEHSAE